jgi:outer membrane protein assembly factor BamB
LALAATVRESLFGVGRLLYVNACVERNTRKPKMMNAMKSIRFAIPIAICAVIGVASAADWPQWRGPNRDGISKETGLLQEWPAEGPKLLWQQSNLGDGYSTPSVVGDRIFLVSNKGLENEFVQALSIDDGHQLWQTHIGKVGKPKQNPNYPGARSTPTVDGEVLYALGSDGDLACMDIAKGKIRWKKNLQTDFGGQPGTWAYAESPLVDGDVVVVTPGGKDATLIALNKKTGDVFQKYPVPEGDAAGYSSIIIVDAAGVRQYVQFLAKGVVGVDAKTGKFLWRYDKTTGRSPANISTPVAGDSCIYTGTHYTGGGLVKLSPDGMGGVKTDEVYFDKKLPTAIGGEILLGDYMYGTNKAQFFCVEFKTGKIKWDKDRTMAPSSLCYADNRLYLHGETDGDVALIEDSPEGYKEHGHFTPPNIPEKRPGKAWTYPVVANGRLYIHDFGTLWCYDVMAANGRRTAARSTTPGRN